MIEARFDDLRPGRERSFRLEEPAGVIEVLRTDEVAGAIRAVEAATERGLWAGGFVAYEAAPAFDPHLEVRERDPGSRLPLAWFGLFERRTEIDPPPPPTAEAPSGPSPWRPSVDRETHAARVATIREAIAAGDTYQVNHTVRLRARIQGDARGLYRDLCHAQRGGYCAYIDTGNHRIASASPELFFELDGDTCTTRPMKGTARRGRYEAEDSEIAARLLASDKDRAENAMIVDLLRNDLGRIARPGSVEVPSMFDLERYETVWQLTSTVRCQPRPGTGLLDLFRALFPCGSVTGAPKVSTMRFIAELEDSPRGVYCGAVGYVAPPSSSPRASFNVAIRTVVVDSSTGDAEYGVGGGITYASDPAAEYEEVLAKAAVLTTTRPAFELFETLRLEDGVYSDLDEHLARIAASARYFGFAHDEAAMRAALTEEAARSREPRRVRLALARDGGLSVTTGELPTAPDGPIRIALDDEPVDPSDVWLFHKTTNRGVYERRASKRPEVEVLLVNDRGEITETAIANVAVKLEGTWWTPPLTSGLLAGTARARLLREGTLAERPISVGELRGAEAIALVSSVRGWREATLVD